MLQLRHVSRLQASRRRVRPRRPGPGARGSGGAIVNDTRNTRTRVMLAAPLEAQVNPSYNHGPIDPVLAAVVIALIGFGVVMVYSASAVQATVQHADPQFYLKRQAAYAVASLVTLFGLSR